MDVRFALLLQTFSGMKLSAVELTTVVCASGLEPAAELCGRLQAGTRDFLSRVDWFAEGERVWSESQERGVRWSWPGLPDYPANWYELSHAPPLFSYIGQPVWREWPLLAIVGSRTPMTETCLWMQRELPRFLRDSRVAVVSGGARGVDQWAHRLALASARPAVAVFPSGVLNPYPFEREELWEAILLQDGCLLSTFAPHEPLRKSHFHTRNRWIAGLAPLTFVVEGNRRSGSLLTAALAQEEGRELAALPVSPFAPQGQGGLDLIAQGADMIRDAEDLSVAMSRALSPRAAQGIEREKEE